MQKAVTKWKNKYGGEMLNPITVDTTDFLWHTEFSDYWPSGKKARVFRYFLYRY